MTEEKAPRISYQYLANKKKYILGLRVRHLRVVGISIIGGLSFIGVKITLTALIAWVLIGYFIDGKQKKESRNYWQSMKAWNKTKNVSINDIPGGVLKLFKNEKD